MSDSWYAIQRQRHLSEMEQQRRATERVQTDKEWYARAFRRECERVTIITRMLADLIDAAECAGPVRSRLQELEDIRKVGKAQVQKLRFAERAKEMAAAADLLTKSGRPLSAAEFSPAFPGVTPAGVRTRLGHFWHWVWLDQEEDRPDQYARYTLGPNEEWKTLAKQLPVAPSLSKSSNRGDELVRLHREVQILRQEIAELKAAASSPQAPPS